MKRLKGGPELKMPNLRVPAFLEALYFDLKDRRLLPLVALAIVAIIAAPFLLAGGSDKPEGNGPVGGPGTAGASGAQASLTVVKANPGLRDYRKRLGRRTPTDPFRQNTPEPDLSGTELGEPGNNAYESPVMPESTSESFSSSTSIRATETSETVSTTQTENGVTTTETETQTSSPTQIPSDGGGESGEPSSPSLFAYTIDVKIKATTSATEAVPGATEGASATETEIHSKTSTRSNVLAPAPLPSEKTEVVVFLGVSPKTELPLLLVSDEVTSIFGEAKCVAGAQTCQLLEVEAGMPVTFVYGPAGDRYKMTVLKAEPAGAGKASASAKRAPRVAKRALSGAKKP